MRGRSDSKFRNKSSSISALKRLKNQNSLDDEDELYKNTEKKRKKKKDGSKKKSKLKKEDDRRGRERRRPSLIVETLREPSRTSVYGSSSSDEGSSIGSTSDEESDFEMINVKKKKKNKRSNSKSVQKKSVFDDDDDDDVSSEDLSTDSSFSDSDIDVKKHRKQKVGNKRAPTPAPRRRRNVSVNAKRSKSQQHYPHQRKKSTSRKPVRRNVEKNKKKKKGKQQSGGGGLMSMIMPVFLLAGFSWALINLGGKITAADPDSILSHPLPTPKLYLSDAEHLYWKPSGKRKVVRDVVNAPLMTKMKRGVVTPKFEDDAKMMMEGGIVSGNPVAGPPNIAFVSTVGEQHGKRYVKAINPSTGALVWNQQFEFSGNGEITPLVLGSEVVFPTSCRTLSSYGVHDGQHIWTTELHSGVDLCEGGIDLQFNGNRNCIVGLAYDGHLVAVDPSSGKLLNPKRKLSCEGDGYGGIAQEQQNEKYASSSSSSQKNHCILSKMTISDKTGDVYFIAKPPKVETNGGGGWFSSSRSSSSSSNSNVNGQMLYMVSLSDSEADLTDRFMFRVEKSKPIVLGRRNSFVKMPPLEISADGELLVVGIEDCMVNGLNPVSLDTIWTHNMKNYQEDCVIGEISFSEDSDFYIASQTQLVKMIQNDNGKDVAIEWTYDFPLYDNLHSTEQVRVLSKPLIVDNGILVRVGTTRGSHKTIVQAGIVLLDRDQAQVRSFTAISQISFSDLAVGALGEIISTRDGKEFLSQSNEIPIKQNTYGIITFKGVPTQTFRDAVCSSLARLENANNYVSSSWFQEGDTLVVLHDILHAKQMLKQAIEIGESSITSYRSQLNSLKHAYESVLNGKDSEYILENSAYIINTLWSPMTSICQ